MAEAHLKLSEISDETTGDPTDEFAVDVANDVFGSFYLGDSEFAISARILKDVINSPDEFTPQPLSPDYLLGIMSLRGMTIPVIDLRIMFAVDECKVAPESRKIAIIEYADHHIGFMFDQTSEVFRGNRADCDFINYEEPKPHAVTTGSFRFSDGERVIQLLDTKSVVEQNGSPFTSVVKANQPSVQLMAKSRGDRQQSITFRVDTIELAINMANIQEVVLVDDVDNKMLASGCFLGTTSLRGITIPLIDLSCVLNLAADSSAENIAEKRVIIAGYQDKQFGLVVDEICNIVQYYNDELLDFPVFAIDCPELFVGCLNNNQADQIIQIDIAKLSKFDKIALALEACENLFPSESAQTKSIETIGSPRSETFLTFQIDRLYGLSILDISEVVNYPPQMVQPPMLDTHLEGVLNLRENMINVVSARKLYGIEDAPTGSDQIIIFQCDEVLYGLAIASINSIVRVKSNQRKTLPHTLLNTQSKIFEDIKEAIIIEQEGVDDLQDIVILDPSSIAKRISNR